MGGELLGSESSRRQEAVCRSSAAVVGSERWVNIGGFGLTAGQHLNLGDIVTFFVDSTARQTSF